MDNSEDENISLLLSMGFPDITEIKRALHIAKNDLNEAVSLLTNEQAFSGADTSSSFRPASSLSGGDKNEGDSNVFPEGNLYELESRVFTDQWSIPYKRDESLGKCLEAAARLANEGLHDADENCRRFVERCLPESFRKLLDSHAVKRWGTDIHRGIYTMLELFIDFLVPRLKHDPIPLPLLSVLSMALEPDCEYNNKNRNQLANIEQWDEAFGSANMYYAVSPSNLAKDPYGWLVDILNYFGSKQGFQAIQHIFSKDTLDFESMNLLLQPFSKCVEYLNPLKVKQFLGSCMSKAFSAVKKIEDKELKSRNVTAALDLLVALKSLCAVMYPNPTVNIDDTRLEIVLRMLKIPHFATRMNALKEVSKFVEESDSASHRRGAIATEKVLEWITRNKVMSIALEGNIDHIQYTERIKNLLEFLGPRLSTEDLTHIWALADRQTSFQAVDNIYAIIAPTSAKFGTDQFDHLLRLIQDKWKSSGDRPREKLIYLLAQVGKECRYSKNSPRALEVLWELIHCETLPPSLIKRGLEAHSSILADLPAKENTRQLYMTRCIEDIREGRFVYIAVSHLLNLVKNLSSGREICYKTDRAILVNLNRQFDLISLFTKSLIRSHEMAVMSAHSQGTSLSAQTIVQMKFAHQQTVNVHLQAIDYTLKEIRLDMPWVHCQALWDTLVTNPDACESDRDTCFDWFTECLPDLEAQTQIQVFKEKLLNLDPVTMTVGCFSCLRMYFENVNVTEERFRRCNTSLIVDRLEPTGIEFFWQVALLCKDDEVADQAIYIIHECMYHSLDPKLKKDPLKLHQRFINECYKRLEASMAVEKDTGNLASTLQNFAALSPEVKETYIQQVVRLLTLLEKYIVTIEEGHMTPRTILPHGASYKGEPVTLHIFCEDAKTELTIDTHINETVWALRRRIAITLNMEPDQITLVMNGDHILQPNKDQKLIKQIGVMETPTLVVKDSVSNATVASGAKVTELRDHPLCPSPMSIQDETEGVADSEAAGRTAHMLEMEKMLPGVVIATSGKVFEILYTLAELNIHKVTDAVRRVIALIPTDMMVSETFQKIATMSEKAAVGGRIGLFRSSSSGGIKIAPRPVGSHVSNLMKTFATSSSGGASSKLGGSPVLTRSKSRLSTPTPGSGEEKCDFEKPQSIAVDGNLKKLFSLGQQGTSAFRLLYNLEVLSSKLMPAKNSITNLDMALEFRERFLTVGGLSLVLGVLQQNSPSQDADYELRQSCYFIALQLARFLLCGEAPQSDTTIKKQHLMAPVTTPCLVRTPSTPVKPSTPGKTATPTKPLSGSKSTQLFNLTPQRDTCEDLAKKKYAVSVMETLSEEDLKATVGCLLRLAWAAAAGRLSLATAGVIVGGTGSLGRPRRGQPQGAQSEPPTELQAGICTLVTSISSRDALIACEALGLLVTCLELRSQALEHFTAMPGVKDFVIDVILGCSSSEVRSQACDLFYRLSQVPSVENQSPKKFLTQVLVSTPVPLWVPTNSARSASYRLLSQCTEYFALRCRLHNGLSHSDQEYLGVSACSMLDDELAWLSNYSPVESKPNDNVDGDSGLLMGHLHLIRALLTCEGVDKKEVGAKLIPDLLRQYLFPASLVIAEGPKIPRVSDTLSHFSPKCRDVESRTAAYGVLVELSTGCRENLEQLVKKLVAIHHRYNPDMAKEFEYEPAVEGRAVSNFVGLKNAGATCYMNGVIQQLLLVPGIAEAVLSIQEDDVDEDSLFFQFQMVVGHLLESKLQYYIPEKFWASLRLRGQPINVREQQDAFEFFTHLVDNLDEYLFKIGKERVFQRRFGGIFSDQKICKECPHKYERESIFLALNVTVKSPTLIESLEQFVKGELLEGDNAYYCEACVQKRSATKRLCIKTLPSTLVIQLKRFYYDWEAGRSLKFDDYFQFPWTLDMKPYTSEGLEEQDQQRDATVDPETAVPSSSQDPSYTYELVGVVVHSGQANAGHYYSFIKERRADSSFAGSKGKWYKFNDTSVEEVEMTDQVLEAECFGGTYKAKSNDASGFPETRQRYWNAYMLFYDRMEDAPVKQKVPLTPRRTVNRAKSLRSTAGREKKAALSPRGSDSLSQLSELLHAGEQRGIFAGTERMPPKILQNIREENLEFMKSKDVFSPEYYRFIHQVAIANLDKISDPCYSQMSTNSIILVLNFLFHTYLKLRHRESDLDLNEWVECFSRLSRSGQQVAQWTMDKLCSDAMLIHVKPFLLECPNKEIRQAFADLIGHALANYHRLWGDAHSSGSLHRYLRYLIRLLEGDVGNHPKTSAQYFNLLLHYSQMGDTQRSLLLQNDLFKLLLVFLLGCDFGEGGRSNVVSPPMGSPCGPTGPNKMAKTVAIPLPALSPPSTMQRRWTNAQVRDFGDIHLLVANLVLGCDFTTFYNFGNNIGSVAARESTGLDPPPNLIKFVFGEGQILFLQEIVTSCRQSLSVVNGNPSLVAVMLAHLSTNNKTFSKAVLKEIMFQISSGSASELKNLSALLQYLLMINDPVQAERVQGVIDGFSDSESNIGGMLAMISTQNTTDSRRAYQLIKFVVNLAGRLPLAKDNLLQAPARWQFAVNWLKNKMEISNTWTTNQDNDCSNEESNTRIFQRTSSAQVTLEEATALLTDCETSDMEMDNASEVDPGQDVRFDLGDDDDNNFVD